ncbi:hypothetical protein U9M48_025200 [Paspalum notatum var. saurae]|uniref:DUF4371 domain-containing protein n=1 Tax=Paspalum notatum var. saurae TaxID=547442 RepID=A0AAQ3TS34_PASNO
MRHYKEQPRPKNYGVDAFITIGVSNWKNATQIFREHVGKVDSLHNKARQYCEAFRNQRQSVEHVMSTVTEQNEAEYLGRLTVILALVRFLLLQAVAFRSHDESRTSSNKGNFLELTDWLKMRDECVKNLLDNAPGNNLLTSPYVQKDMCEACAKQTTKTILDDIGDKNFSILMDESRDASIKEQMAVVLRYVNNKGHVIERFLGVEHVPDTTSAALKAALDAMLLGHGLSIHNVRGQGYDGASNMRGEFHGLQRLVLDENPYAFYIHCFAHQLQLVVVSVAKCCSSVTDFFNYTTLIVNTVNASCKRHDQLAQEHHENVVRGLENDEIFSGRGKNQETNLARPGDTRWGSHHKTLCRLQLMWQAVLEVLENICDDGPTSATKTCAAGLLKHMESFEFVLIMHLMIKLLGKTNDLPQCLQKKDTNIVRAVSLIGVTLQKVNDIREHGWERVFEATKQFCVKHHIIVPDMSETTVARGRSRGRGGQLEQLETFIGEVRGDPEWSSCNDLELFFCLAFVVKTRSGAWANPGFASVSVVLSKQKKARKPPQTVARHMTQTTAASAAGIRITTLWEKRSVSADVSSHTARFSRSRSADPCSARS